MTETISEAATLKALAKRLMRDMADLLAQRNVPEILRREIEDVRVALKKTWADLETEADGAEPPESEEPMPEMAEIIKVRVNGGDPVPLTDLAALWAQTHPVKEAVTKSEGDEMKEWLAEWSALSIRVSSVS